MGDSASAFAAISPTLVTPGGLEKPYWIYQTAIFGRSVFVIITVLIAELFIRKAPVFSVLPFRTTGVAPDGIRVLNVLVPYSSHQNIRKVRSAYTWVVRSAVVLVVCFGFENLILLNTRFDMRKPQQWNNIMLSCFTGWDCYAFQAPNASVDASVRFDGIPSFLPVYFVWDLQHVCRAITSSDTTLDESILQRTTRNSSVVCYKPGVLQFSESVATLGLMGAAAALVFIFFELIVGVILRYRRSVWNVGLLVDVAIVLCLCGWIIILILEGLTAIATWVSRLTVLIFPVLLFCARSVGNVLRQELEKKQELRGRELLQGKLGEELDKLAGSGEDLMNCDDDDDDDDDGDLSSKHRKRGFRHKPRRFKARGLWGRLKHGSSQQLGNNVTEEGTSERSTAL